MLRLRFHVKNQSVIVSGSLSFALHVHFTQALCQAVYCIDCLSFKQITSVLNESAFFNIIIISALYTVDCFTASRMRFTYEGSVLLDFSLTVKAAPHECVIRTSQP